jgi:hypothetical protein
VLAELGHPQPPTQIHIETTTIVGIVNNTIKQQRSRAMKMQYFWLLDGKTQRCSKFYYQPSQEHLGNYPSKHHTADIKTRQTILHPHEKLLHSLAMSYEAKHSSRVS